MKKALLKDSIKQIINTYKRFISILLMAFLGVGFFAGIRAASPDMVDTINNYYIENKVYDIQILSTLGLTNEDIEEISKIDNIDEVIGTYELDGKLEIDNKEVITKIMCIEDLNNPVLLQGEMPKSQEECVVEEKFFNANNKQIGDYIELEVEDTQNDDGDKISYLNQNKLKIVGVVQSPLYVSADRGTSNLGSGKIDYYMYITKDNINAKDIYTSLYMKVKDSEKYTTSSKKYEDYIETVKQKIEEIKNERQNARYNQLVNKANQKVDDAQKEFDEQKQDATQKINDAESKINNGKNEIQKAENELAKSQKEADIQFANAKNQLNSAKSTIAQNESNLKQQEETANKKFSEMEQQKQGLQAQLNNVVVTIPTLEQQYNQMKDVNVPEEQKQALQKQIQELQQTKKTLEDGIAQIDSGIASGKQEIESGKQQIQNAKVQLQAQEKQYQSTKTSTNNKLANARAELEKSKKELQTGEEELQKNKEEFDTKIKEAEEKLIDARTKIQDIEHPTWYILDRNGNSGYSSFIQDTKSVENIAKVFPIVFFIIATLISLTSMTRMIDEQRTQIGTLKALGYNKLQIASKYIIYASLACIIGGILGMSVGFVLLPKVIWLMYQMMYKISDIHISFNLEWGLIGLILISVCIIGATVYAAFRKLVYAPATLMRPKAPKMGKRVLLEKIPFIWKHLKFTQKVTVRNIFRYKKRFLMTIIGIMGCTSLILVGFGLQNSITSLMPRQFEKVFKYDMQIALKSGLTEEQKQEYISKLQEKSEIEKVVETYMTSTTAINNENEEEVQIIVPKEQSSLEGVINIVDIQTKGKIELKNNEVALSDKLAELLGVKEGDTVTLKDSDENEIKMKISNIAENYISHYIYMSKETYESLYGKKYDTNVLFTQNGDITEEQEDNLSTEIMQSSETATVTRISSLITMLDDTMKSLNYVVIVLIVSAGLLAFVVLYNLSNVNISERIRELATIKVLGFYDKEVYFYVTRETVILTLIGIVLGFAGGYFLNSFIIGTCEINMLRFPRVIYPVSYLYAALITVLFTVIVNVVTFFALKKIDMIESLKSVE